MNDSHCAASVLIAMLIQAGSHGACAGEPFCTAALPLANGNMVVCWAQSDEPVPPQLLIHFHGSPQTVKEAFARSSLKAVLVVINFPGLSMAYAKPFEMEPDLFAQICDRALQEVNSKESRIKSPVDWQRVSVSSFSAGYGAVREILKTPKYFERIDTIFAADSIYAGLQDKQPQRRVDENNMRDFLRFARLAVDRKKSFIISHSALPTAYASTEETADYLLSSLSIDRESGNAIRTAAMRQLSHASRGRFLVMGFEGTSGKEHMAHLHNIDLIWNCTSK